MPQYNLTDTQKQVLVWIVGEVRSGELREDEIWFSWTKDGTSLLGYKGNCPEVNRSSLDALQASGLIICDRRRHEYKCALTGAAYDAVDSDFGAPDMSFINHLRPIEGVEHLDEEIRKRCLYSLSAGGNEPEAWDKAVRTATVILEERLREIGNVDSIDPNATGSQIVNLVFGQNGTLRSVLGDQKARAYRDLYSGAMLVFRNHYGHRLVDPSPQDGGAVISFVDLLLKMLEDLR